jgi:hypothetical protein
MRKPLLLMVLFSLLLLAACGGDGKRTPSDAAVSASDRDAGAVDAGDEADSRFEESSGPSGVRFAIMDCAFKPDNPTAFDDLTVIPVLNEEFASDESALSEVVFSYRWIVQNREIADAKGDTLERQHYKKKDWVQCRVRASFNGRRTPEFRSKVIAIQNSLPELQPRRVEPFTVPGEVRYQISASDPDNDPLTYALLSPLNLGIRLDARTGLIAWTVDEVQAKDSAPVTIRFAVSDPDGGKVESSITFSFSPTAAQTP